jgi:hypothetical protein
MSLKTVVSRRHSPNPPPPSTAESPRNAHHRRAASVRRLLPAGHRVAGGCPPEIPIMLFVISAQPETFLARVAASGVKFLADEQSGDLSPVTSHILTSAVMLDGLDLETLVAVTMLRRDTLYAIDPHWTRDGGIGFDIETVAAADRTHVYPGARGRRGAGRSMTTPSVARTEEPGSS